LTQFKGKAHWGYGCGTIVIMEQGLERSRRKKDIDKTITKWEHRLPVLQLDDAQRSRMTSDDWQLLILPLI
jgi:hypothetical protein